MSAQPHRLASGGLIDRARTLRFTFDGRALQGHPGDTLASALIANGVKLVGRSFKYHRPRGIYSAGPEEPNALVRVRSGAHAEPNTRATMVALHDGLVAQSQNRWPSLGFDLLGINSLLGRFIPAGFYYKTFMGPPGWMFWEHWIRKAAGLGEMVFADDPDRYEKIHHHCDVLVVGSGPAGLAAAREAAASGARVVLCDEREELGGSALFERATIEGKSGKAWVDDALASLARSGDVTLLPRTTAFGYYDHNTVALVERVQDHLPASATTLPRQRVWVVVAKQVVLATGAIERPLVFAGNDKPGVMLASAARRYVNQYAVAPGMRAVVATNNDDAYRTAIDLHDAGIAVRAVVDARPLPVGELVQQVAARGIEILAGRAPARVHGGREVSALDVGPVVGDGIVDAADAYLDCDLVCVSGGWSPSVHLHSQSGGKLAWDDAIAAFVPGASKQACVSVGAAAGKLGEGIDLPLRPLWEVRGRAASGKRFVDIQDDVTADDVALAQRENFVSVEHLKRYTTLGMGTDQGKTSNINGLAIMARLTARSIPETGTTTFRPPYTPVAMGNFANHAVGKHLAPTRRTPMHDWHVAHGALMYETGPWLRPRAYPKPGESFRDAWIRETKLVRARAGLVDVSTLGKIEISGPDALTFIERIYCNGFATLAVGKARYGLMLREDGIVFDDGTVARLAADRFYVTCTTAGSAKVMQHIEQLLQVEWPDLRVQASAITDQNAQMALAGPASRDVLRRAMADTNVDDNALPHLGVLQGRVAGAPVIVFRMSYSGERAYEIATPADHGTAVWEAILAAGAEPYGTEAMAALRIEKGHVAGAELDGRTTAADLGLGKFASAKKHYIGRRLQERAGLRDTARAVLVGLDSIDGQPIPAGSILVRDDGVPPPVPKLGHVTSVTYSPTLDRNIALALLANGRALMGEQLVAAAPLVGKRVPVRVVDPFFFDPKGERMHG
jgi:glycine cleavage system aminomethyltransferase T/NADPH-dependent 2,4-dienoyl-CoA reductase/sulfur reductase-like enzyme